MKKKFTAFIIIFLCFINNALSQTFSVVGCESLKNRETIALGFYNGTLVHSGFDSICNLRLGAIGIWNDTNWNTLGGGVPDNSTGTWPPSAFFSTSNNLFVGGGFDFVGNKRVNKIARWNGNEWFPLNTGLDELSIFDKILSLAWFNGSLYAAGHFNRMDGQTGYNCIARWDNQKWNKVSGGVTRNGVGREITCMQVYKNELYVAGYFDQAGTKTTNNIARWNGNVWNTVGNGGAWNGINDMVVDTIRNVLYIGGDFNGVDSNILSKKIAMWDGVKWNALPDPPLGSSISALEMYHGYLYAGSMGNNHLARWDGEKWDSVPGFNSTINALQTYNDALYIGGSFTRIGNDSIPYLVKYYSPDSVIVGISTSQKITHKKIKIFPNPSKDLLQIESQIKINSYKITDLNGRIIQEGIIDKVQYVNSTYSISIVNLIKGIYFIHVFSEDKSSEGSDKFTIN